MKTMASHDKHNEKHCLLLLQEIVYQREKLRGKLEYILNMSCVGKVHPMIPSLSAEIQQEFEREFNRAPPKRKRKTMWQLMGVLTRRKCSGKWCASFGDPCLANLVALNCEILNWHDFWNFGYVPSSPNTPKYNPTPAFPFIVVAFPFNVMAFPVTGRSQLLGVPMVWRRRQAMAKWRWGRGPHTGPPRSSATLLVPSATSPWPGVAAGHGNAQ